MWTCYRRQNVLSLKDKCPMDILCFILKWLVSITYWRSKSEAAIFRVYWTDSYYDIDGSLVMVKLFFLPLPLLDSWKTFSFLQNLTKEMLNFLFLAHNTLSDLFQFRIFKIVHRKKESISHLTKFKTPRVFQVR